MIEFNYQTENFRLQQSTEVSHWLETIVENTDKSIGEISYVFCDDEYLLKINQDFLSHDYYTDIISFDYSLGNQLNGEIYISVDRVIENAAKLNLEFKDELHRVMAHGILHFLGFKDKTEQEAEGMRTQENLALKKRVFI